MREFKDHWENIYITKTENEVSWFQPYPKTSMDFISLFDLPADANIIDVGGGDSHFVDALLEKGFRNIYILDISENAIERAKKRLGNKKEQVHWIVSDVLQFEPPVSFDLWHDRAAFHFLTSDKKIDHYITLVEKSVKKNGHLVLGTFSENGPQKCSGLEIKRYSADAMSSTFEHAFEKIKCIHENHITPFNTRQNFLFCSFRKRIQSPSDE